MPTVPPSRTEAAPVTFTYPPQLPGRQTSPPTVTAPAVPATTVAATNTTGVDVMVYLAGTAAVTVVKVNGTTTGLTIGSSGCVSYFLPAGATTALTYASTAPTWVWMAA